MEKKTIGQFIAVLRKANGLTQQDLADRLNVSNKAVSRWERDESAPDITLIPALAEILGVTCDELLKGERITYSGQVEKKDVKVEKQVKALIQREISKYRTLMWIALALVVIGFVLPFALMYSYYFTEAICVAAMFLFEVVAFVMVTIAVAQMRDIKADSELFENAEEALIKRFHKCLGDLSYLVYYLIASVLWLMSMMWYGNQVLSVYGVLLFHGIILFEGYWLLKEKYVAWITGEKRETKSIRDEIVHKDRFQKMNRIQIVAVISYGALFFFAPCFEPSPEDWIVETITSIIAIGLLLVNIVSSIVFSVKEKENRKTFIFYGIRNILLLPSAFLFSEAYQISWEYQNGGYVKHDSLYEVYIIVAAACALGVIVLFKLLERVMRKKTE